VIPTVPKPAAERTLVVAALVLGTFAMVQLIAAVVALAPQVRFTTDTRTTESPVASASAAAPSASAVERAQTLYVAANEAFTQGDLQVALDAVGEADHLVPNEPGILVLTGTVLEATGRRVEALEVYGRILALPVDPANPDFATMRGQAEARLAALEGGAPGAVGNAPSAALMRDEIGIPIGSVIGIVDARIADEEAGFKHLRIATKASQAVTVDPGELKMQITFYEQNDFSEILPTTSGLKSEWLSPLIDWANGEPELLDVRYSLPADDRGDLPPLQYYGWVLGIYYQGELQDSRAEPVSLLDEFPLALTRDDL
jgi:tetratricopeptide (TPR) repeat protein